MKKIFSIIIIALLLSSCITQKRCKKRFLIHTKDSIVYRESLVLFTDTIFIKIPADTAKIQALVNCDSLGMAQMQPQTIETNNQITTVSVTDGLLSVHSECKEKELRKIITTQQKMIEAFKNSVSTTMVKYTPKWVKPYVYFSIPFILIALFCLVMFVRTLLKNSIR